MLFENITIFAIVSWKKFITNVYYATILIVYYIKRNYTYNFFFHFDWSNLKNIEFCCPVIPIWNYLLENNVVNNNKAKFNQFVNIHEYTWLRHYGITSLLENGEVNQDVDTRIEWFESNFDLNDIEPLTVQGPSRYDPVADG